MEYRQADLRDIDIFLENRMEFASLMREIADPVQFREDTRRYLEEHIGKDDLIIFLAMEGEEIISACMACIFTTVPLPSCASGKTAEILNVYTMQEYRAQGHAKKLLRMLLDEARHRGVEKAILISTEEGYPLYKNLGFQLMTEKKMRLKI
jgi:ribosomal protein S18 acetylase RimI-like enzyme